MCTDGGCEAALTAGMTCGCVRLRECGELLCMWKEVSHKAERRCLQELCKASHSVRK